MVAKDDRDGKKVQREEPDLDASHVVQQADEQNSVDAGGNRNSWDPELMLHHALRGPAYHGHLMGNAQHYKSGPFVVS